MLPGRSGRADSELGAGEGKVKQRDVAAKSIRPSWALALLLGINLFNYIDRQILAAVEPMIRDTFFAPGDPQAQARTGLLATAFLISYMLLAPVFGWLADRMSRWTLVGISVILWSLASGASGLAAGFGILLMTRLFVGVGEAGYGPSAPTLIADLFPVERRGRMLSIFYLAIPVGSALGYVIGGKIAAVYGWRAAFYAVVPPGLLLGGLALFVRDSRPARAASSGRRFDAAVIRRLFSIRSYAINTAAMTAMTFAIGGMSFWIPGYIYNRLNEGKGPDPELLAHVNFKFGIIVVIAGLTATLAGGWISDKLRPRFPGAYFLTSGIAMLIAFPFTIAFLKAPFPLAWYFIFGAVFFIFLNTGPANAALANVTPPQIRGTAFALNILAIHLLGDAISPPLIGWIAGYSSMNSGFLAVSGMVLVSGIFWLIGARYLGKDTDAVTEAEEATL